MRGEYDYLLLKSTLMENFLEGALRATENHLWNCSQDPVFKVLGAPVECLAANQKLKAIPNHPLAERHHRKPLYRGVGAGHGEHPSQLSRGFCDLRIAGANEKC